MLAGGPKIRWMVTGSAGGVGVSPPQSGVGWRIRRFLESHPGVPLTVSVRSLTIKGLAWLEPLCRDRSVRVVVGRWRPSAFRLAGAADRDAAVALLSRSEVVVRAWAPERQPPVLVNTRAWVAHTKSGPSVLLCSADLTNKGLHANWEVAAAAADSDRQQVAAQVDAIAAHAQDLTDTMLALVAGDDQRPARNRPPAPKPATADTPARPSGGAAERIEAFLEAYPHGRVTVAVGFASVSGLAWLSERVSGRPVTLFIGNAQHRRFKNANAGDRAAALAFLRRPDVQVRNWYRKHGTDPAEAHLKAWIVEGKPQTVLTGSANLTSAGLFQNYEIMAEIHGPDRAPAVTIVSSLIADAWDYKKELIRAIDRQEPTKTTTPKPSPDPVPTRPVNTDQPPPPPDAAANRTVAHRPERTRASSRQHPGPSRRRRRMASRPIQQQIIPKPNRGRLIGAVVAVVAVVVLGAIVAGRLVCSQESWFCNALLEAYRSL